MRQRPPSPLRRVTAATTALALMTVQLAIPPAAHAAHQGSMTVSAGSAPPPAVTAIESFQPDLFTGRATTSIPIAVPPGRKGLQPNLALTYSSSARNGWVGVGWTLDLGYIERSTKGSVPAYTDTDDTFTFLLQGVTSELVKIPDGTYRAKDEGLFLRFDKQGVSGWEVHDRAGTRYLFGQTAASQITTPSGVFRWCLDAVIDVHGNRMDLTYTTDQNQRYLSQIRYTSHEPTGLPPANQVDFILEDRTDIESTYQSGTGIITAKRLAAIEVKATVGGTLTLARRYDLGYAASAQSDRSLLASITQTGTDGATTLPATTFTYSDAALPTYSAVSTLATGADTDLLIGDVDGNGVSDLVTVDGSSGTWTVRLGRPGGFDPPATWITGFGDALTPLPYLLGDFDGDGRTDIAMYQNGTWSFARSTGTSFDYNPTAWPSVTFGTSADIPLTGDFNGDGSLDLGTFHNGDWVFRLASGDGTNLSFDTAAPLTVDNWGLTTYGPRIGDFNGDGITDIGIQHQLDNQDFQVRLATGNGWATATIWSDGLLESPSLTVDLNSDGMTDVAYLELANGEIVYLRATGAAFTTGYAIHPVTFTLHAAGDELKVGDFNGDGLFEPAVFRPDTGALEHVASIGTPPDLLTRIDTGLGSATTITYTPSTTCNNLCPIHGVPNLPFVIPLVADVTVDDGLGNTITTAYDYALGAYDAPTKEFRGFGIVDVQDANGTVSTTEFHQDAARRGRPFRTEVRDAADNLWTTTEQTWLDEELFPGVHFVKLDETDQFVYDGNTDFRQVRASFDYDQYGNVTAAYEEGEPALTGDERTTLTTYTVNTTDWIVGTPSLIQTQDDTGTVIAQRRFYYDGAASHLTAPTAGLLTTEEEWRNLPTAAWLATTLTYDATGNVATITDAEGRTTTNTYDAEGTYLTTIANHLGHSRQLVYDPRFGQITDSTDQNGVTTTTEYDVLGRITKVIGPTDTPAQPTMRYEYDPCLATGACTAPIRTTVHTRIESGQPVELTVHTFTDGLGRTIQTRAPAEDPAKQVVSGSVEFDARGQVSKQWVPYLDDLSAAYVSHTAIQGLAPPVTYAYDPLGRVTATTDPDGTVTTAAYDDWTTTTTDGNGRPTHRTADAYGRLVQVQEVNDTAAYTTTYAYDALENLITVTDHVGNVTQLTYDSLGRKLTMDDPDMGLWSYAYDDVDNLTSQTDARGVTTSFTYDALNRLTQKSYTIPGGSGIPNPGTVTYTYDDPAVPFATGKLTAITDGSGASAFEYDTLGRLIEETKTVESTPRVMTRAYDLLGRLTSLAYPDGSTAAYTYNDQGGIETVTLTPDGGAPEPILTDLAYNAAGQVTQITYGNGMVSDYGYDSETLRLKTLETEGPAGKVQDFVYTFDAAGNVKTIADNANSGNQTFWYDHLNRLTVAQGESYGTLTYAYDALGNMTEKAGVAQTYGENGAGPHAVTSTAAGLTLTYDANGNMQEKRSASGTVLQSFLFDAENRLAEVESAAEETVTLALEPGWNLVSLPVLPEETSVGAVFPTVGTEIDQVSRYDAATDSWAHYVGNVEFDQFSEVAYGVGYQVHVTASAPISVEVTGRRPTSASSVAVAPGWHLLGATALGQEPTGTWLAGVDFLQVQAYDAGSSSLTSVMDADPSTGYWVEVNTASSWTPATDAPVTTTFVYDGDGGKVKRIEPSGTTLLLGEVFEVDPAGVETVYVFAGAQRVAARLSTGETRFYHGDHLGSANVVTDGAGSLVQLTEHTPFGSVSRSEGSVVTAHQFTGQRQDPLHGLVLFPARAYDPALGRFLSPDPFVQDPADPQTLNRYSYVRNNPVRYVDPSGNFFSFIIAVVVAAVAGGVVGGALAAATGGSFKDGFLAGAAAGATFVAAGALAAAALPSVISTAATATTLAQFSAITAAGAVGGGVSAELAGGSFGQGALAGGLLAGATFGVGRLIGPALQRRLGELVSPKLAQTADALARSSVSTQLQRGLEKVGLGAKSAARASRTADTIPAGKRLSTVRLSQRGETYERFESTKLGTKVLEGGGLEPGTHATRNHTGLSQLNVNEALNLPFKHIPRDRRFIIEPPPGTPLVGPKPIIGGTESEVQFIYGIPRGSGSVRGPFRVPKR